MSGMGIRERGGSGGVEGAGMGAEPVPTHLTPAGRPNKPGNPRNVAEFEKLSKNITEIGSRAGFFAKFFSSEYTTAKQELNGFLKDLKVDKSLMKQYVDAKAHTKLDNKIEELSTTCAQIKNFSLEPEQQKKLSIIKHNLESAKDASPRSVQDARIFYSRASDAFKELGIEPQKLQETTKTPEKTPDRDDLTVTHMDLSNTYRLLVDKHGSRDAHLQVASDSLTRAKEHLEKYGEDITDAQKKAVNFFLKTAAKNLKEVE
jgi:hypothetical protein